MSKDRSFERKEKDKFDRKEQAHLKRARQQRQEEEDERELELEMRELRLPGNLSFR